VAGATFLARCGITGFSHIGLHSTNPRKDEAFWTTVTNARVSDWIGEAPLLRIDPCITGWRCFRRSVAACSTSITRWRVSTTSCGRTTSYGNGTSKFDLGRSPSDLWRHVPVLRRPDGMIYEYSSGVGIITDEDAYRPRQFPAAHTSFCAWGSKPDIPEFEGVASFAETVNA